MTYAQRQAIAAYDRRIARAARLESFARIATCSIAGFVALLVIYSATY